MDVRAFDFDLPSELIAQEPATDRAGARLLCLDRPSGVITHTVVAAVPDLLSAGDVVVVNDTRVFPARLIGRRSERLAGRFLRGAQGHYLVFTPSTSART